MAKDKVVLLMPAGQRPGVVLGLAPPELEVSWVDLALTDEEKVPLCKDADAIIAMPPWFPANLLKSCPKVRLVQTLTSGYNRLDIEGIIDLGIPVANNAGINAATLAEHTVGFILTLCRKMVALHTSVKEGRWQGGLDPDQLVELYGKTVGIVGLGAVGKELAKRLKGFDVRTIYHTRSEVPTEVQQELNASPVSREQLLLESDFVTLHVPLTPKTRGMIGEQELAMMKPSSYLLNTCRGPVVDEAALYRALKEGLIAGAGLDVFEREPLTSDSPLLQLDNVVFSPHMSGSSHEGSARSVQFAYANVKRVLGGEAPQSLVSRDRSNVGSGPQSVLHRG